MIKIFNVINETILKQKVFTENKQELYKIIKFLSETSKNYM